EVAHAGEDHGHVVFVGGRDHFLVADRTAGLDHCRHAGRGGGVDAITEREEGIRSHGAAGHVELGVLRLDGGDACADDTAHLAGADTYGPAVARVHDGVGFHEHRHVPGEQQV